MSRRKFFAGLLLVALLLAGVVSYFASASPDGLEHVAHQHGIADTARDSATADSPLADYQTKGVDDGVLSGGLAGVIGVGVTLLLAGGLAYVVRRKEPEKSEQ